MHFSIYFDEKIEGMFFQSCASSNLIVTHEAGLSFVAEIAK